MNGPEMSARGAFGSDSGESRSRRRSGFVPGLEPETWQPALDVYETAQAMVILVDLAGVKADTVHLDVHGRVLRMSGRRQLQFRPDYRQFHRLEIRRGSFERVVELPSAVDADAAEASYRDGMLEIVLPFRLPVRPTIKSRSEQRPS